MSTSHSPENPTKRGAKPPLALIAGPTASGKTDLALALGDALAERGSGAVIINADSVQVYRDIPILSAAPTKAEQARHPHRLFGAWDGATACSAADWAARAKHEIAAAHASGTVPILCGGTGLYLRTLLEGLAPVPAIDPAIRAQVRGLSQPDARHALEQEDPAAAARLSPADVARTTRALEVIRSTGKTLAAWQLEKSGGIGPDVSLAAIIVLPPREQLYARCDARFISMIEHGAAQEVDRLLARQLDPSLPVMRAIGVREIGAWLKGDVSRAQMIDAGQRATRQYAKRQYTWFRNQTPQDWQCDKLENYDFTGMVELLLRN